MIKILLSKKLGEMRLTQADLARATGIRPNTINELYHELADRVNLEHLDLICEALDCELDELIVRVPNKDSAKMCIRDSGRREVGYGCNGKTRSDRAAHCVPGRYRGYPGYGNSWNVERRGSMYETIKRIYHKTGNKEAVEKAVKKGWINLDEANAILTADAG